MKKLFLSILGILFSLSVIAQTIGDAFYIYRNDGQFNAFFREEIDSITYSCYDLDSIYSNDYVTQVIYTQDSIYRIPLEVIDSVGFVQPETILQPNVKQMNQIGLMEYLIDVDGMTLLFKSTLPRTLQPSVGDVLLSTDFNHPLLNNGFVGKVKDTNLTDDIFRVNCDSIYDIFDIFEQLISIEKIKNTGSEVKRRASKEWVSSRNPLNFNLGYSHPLSDGEVSLSGSVDGSYIATITYNITRNDQYINLRIDHDWQYGAHLIFNADASFGTLMGPIASLPAIRFPAVAPVFMFQISGSPFVKGEGNMELDLSLSSPIHSFRAQATYHNGHFSGWNHEKPIQDYIEIPGFETAFSLNGSLQAGYMVDLWLGLDVSIPGMAKQLLRLGTGLDFYIGPKLTGDFSMKIGTENPINYYSIYKDSKLGLSLLTVDYEFFGDASFAGHKLQKSTFCNGTIQTPLYHEWYILPEFSDLFVTKNITNLSATVSTTPTRDILFPLNVGLGLYDTEGNLVDIQYESNNYKRENEGFLIKQTFSSLKEDEEYTVKPFIKILGGEIPALSEESFKMENMEIETSYVTGIEQTRATLWGKMSATNQNGEIIGFIYGTQKETLLNEGKNVKIGNVTNSFAISVIDLENNTTYYYTAFYQDSNGGMHYGGIKSFTTKGENDPPIDPFNLLNSKWKWCYYAKNQGDESIGGGIYEIQDPEIDTFILISIESSDENHITYGATSIYYDGDWKGRITREFPIVIRNGIPYYGSGDIPLSNCIVLYEWSKSEEAPSREAQSRGMTIPIYQKETLERIE